MELCWQLGYSHPKTLQKELNQADLADWIAWLRKEPRGHRRDDARSALQTAYIRQSLHGEKEDPESFLLRFDDQIQFADEETKQLVDDFFAPQPLIGF